MMRLYVSLPHAALTASGTGQESFKVYSSKKTPGMWLLRLYPTQYTKNHEMIEIAMDEITAVNLGIINEEQLT